MNDLCGAPGVKIIRLTRAGVGRGGDLSQAMREAPEGAADDL